MEEIMTEREINIIIADYCGWKRAEKYDYPAWSDDPDPETWTQKMWVRNGSLVEERQLPNYCQDLNAIHEAEKIILNDEDTWFAYAVKLGKITRDEAIPSLKGLIGVTSHATALQRSKAFVMILNKWRD